MKTLKLGKADVLRGSLILVNRSHPLNEEEAITNLTPACEGGGSVLLDRRAAKPLFQITSYLNSAGRIVPVSGYRTKREQRTIYEDCLRESGKEFTGKYVAYPGCSEHQTGLAVDLAENKKGIDFIRPDFPDTGICGAFRRLAPRYGFIERYPSGREKITRIAHEPWHFRYVGCPHSEVMGEKALTLEEYTDYLKEFPFEGAHLRLIRRGVGFEVFYISVSPDREVSVELPDETPYEVSGNNVDGVVVTLRRARP